MMTTYTFTLASSQDTPPAPALVNGWTANFYPIGVDAFESLNIHLDQYGGWLTQANGRAGSTGDAYDLTGQFNNFGGFPVSYMVEFDRRQGPSADAAAGQSHYGPSRGSELVFGNDAGFLRGTYPAAFTTASGAGVITPYTVGITPGTQEYSKSDPGFTIPYGIYNCPGNWAIDGARAVCSVDASYRYSFDNTGTLRLAGTRSQTLAPFTNKGYCAAGDGAGTVAVFTDINGSITTATENHGTDAAALAYVAQQFGGPLPAGAQGFLRVDVAQTYEDDLRITSANDGVFDWATLPQDRQDRVTWAGLRVSSPMRTQALYTITATQAG